MPCPYEGSFCASLFQCFLRRVGLGDFDFDFGLADAAELAAAIFFRTRGGRILLVILYPARSKERHMYQLAMVR